MSKTKSEYLSEYSSKDQKWDFHKSASEKVEYFYSTSKNHKRLGERMDSCAELLRYIFNDNSDTGETELKLRDAKFCRVRLCPVCQWRRSMSWRARLFQRLPSLLSENPDLRFIFLTLTVQNCEIKDLSNTLKSMNDAFARFRKLDKFKVVKGFIRATEVTKSENGKAHPHFHCILAVENSYFKSRSYLKTEQWAEMWQKSLKVGYLPVVDARKIRQKGNELESRAIVETLKYTTKVEDLLSDKDWFLELTDQLFKKRFIATGGVLKDMLKEEVSEKEMILLSDEDLELNSEEKKAELKKSLFFGFEPKTQKYKKVKNPYQDIA